MSRPFNRITVTQVARNEGSTPSVTQGAPAVLSEEASPSSGHSLLSPELVRLHAVLRAWSWGRAPTADLRAAMQACRGTQHVVPTFPVEPPQVAVRDPSEIRDLDCTRDVTPPNRPQKSATTAGSSLEGRGVNFCSGATESDARTGQSDRSAQGESMADGALSPIVVRCAHCRRFAPIVDCIACASWQAFARDLGVQRCLDLQAAEDALLDAVPPEDPFSDWHEAGPSLDEIDEYHAAYVEHVQRTGRDAWAPREVERDEDGAVAAAWRDR